MSRLILAVVLLRFIQTPLREFHFRSHIFANDMGQLAHAAVFMIGAAYAWRWQSLVRVDIFYQRMRPQLRAIVDLVGTVALLLPWLGLVRWYSVPLALASVRINEIFPESGSPGYFVLNLLLVVFAVQMMLQAVAVRQSL